MYIAGFYIRNIKCFNETPEISFEGMPHWVVLAGRNGTGKTSLLKSFAMAILGTESSIKLGQNSCEWVSYGEKKAKIAIELNHNSSDKFQGTGRNANLTIAVKLTIKKTNNSKQEEISPLPIKGFAAKAAERGPWASAPQGWFLCGYGPFRHLGPMGMEQLRLNRDPKIARVINLFHEGATLVEAVEWLQYLHVRALEGRASEAKLKEQVLKFLDNGLLPDGSTVERVDSDGLWIRRAGELQLLNSLSDGYRTVAALVLDIVRHLYGCYGDALEFEDVDGVCVCRLPGIVLIDEIDAHMHISWQQKIGFWLCARFPQLQFIVTTHSPFICQAASPGALIRLPAPGEDRQIEVVSDEIYKTVTQGGIDDAVISELFGLDHPHSGEAERNRARLAELEGQMLNGKKLTKKEKAELNHLKDLLPLTMNDLADQKFRAAMHEET